MENWKKIEGFADYSVSDAGNVRRDTPSRGRPLGGIILKPGVGSKGHHYVNLRRNSRSHSAYVHRIVLETFIGLAPAGHCCAHGNGNPSDNRLENLRWATYAENSADSIKHGTSRRPGGSEHFRAKLTAEIIAAAKVRFAAGESARSIARNIGVSHKTMSDAINGRSYKDADNNGGDNSL